MGVDRELGDGHRDQAAILDEPLISLANRAEIGQSLPGDCDEREPMIAANGQRRIWAHRRLHGAFDELV